MLKKIIPLVFIILSTYQVNSSAQWWKPIDDDEQKERESFKDFLPIELIDVPTANILTDTRLKEPQKYFHLSLRVYNLGGMIGSISVGLTRHLMFGISYGGQNVIGEGDVNWHPSPGIQLRYKLFSESFRRYPSIAIGFDSQGFGGYVRKSENYVTEDDRYVIKSKGLYFVASQNFAYKPMNLGLHGGLNYSTESKQGDKDINIFFGAHLIMEEELALIWDYDLGINDNDETSYGSGRGYMNAAVQWLFANRLILEFSVKNLLSNKKDELGKRLPYSNRELKIIYRQEL